MRALTASLTLAVLFSCPAARAQLVSTAPGAQPQGEQKPVQQYYAQDGGTREVLESIVIPPKANAPFSLLLQTEWVKSLSDGGTMTMVNERHIARDSKGRIYQERWYLVPKVGKYESKMNVIQISDPNTHTLYNCLMLEQPHQCVLSTYTPSVNAVYNFNTPSSSGTLPDEEGSTIHDNLGKQLLNGVETMGSRDSIIYNPGVYGNDRKMTIEKEFWYSPLLGINLLSKRSDPRFGTQTFTVTNLILSEPDPNLFDLPAGFTVVDHRQTAAPEN
ncbi:MAG TPA: hypothetical protein VGH37_00065 [Candidatus Acidoferrum sp.]